MVDTRIYSLEEEYLEEMRNTKGWKILEETMLAKHKASVSALVNGSTSEISIEDTVKHRARCAIIREIGREARVHKEDAKWKNVL